MDSVLSLNVDHRGFVSEDDRDKFFRHQFKLPENTKCFDCGFNNPKWTSVSFSIYLCLNCSGRHRQMGSHISFVRSVDMDRFTRDQLVRLYLGGNGEFASYLYSENLLQRPLNYTNKKILSYTSRLDTQLAKYVGKKSPKSDADLKEDVETTQLSNKTQQEEQLSSTQQETEQTELPLQQSVISDNLESAKNTESSASSMRDDAEKMNKLRNDAFSGLLDLISIGNQDSGNKTSPNSRLNQKQSSKQTLESTVAQVKNDILDVFEKFDSVPQSDNSNIYRFDSISKFANMNDNKFEKTMTNDNLLNLDFTNTSVPTITESFTNLTLDSNQYESNKEYNKEGKNNRTKEEYYKDNNLKNTGKSKGSKNKFSSKVINFDFETFEKENTAQFGLHNTTPDVHDTSCFSTGTTGTYLPKAQSYSSLSYSSPSSLPKNTDFNTNTSFGSFSSFGPTGGVSSVPGQTTPPFTSTTQTQTQSQTTATSSAFQTSSTSSSTPMKVYSVSSLPSVSLGSHQSFQPSRMGNTGSASYLNPNPSTTPTGPLLTKHGVPRNKFQSMPDLSQFEGRKSISSDLFFGTDQTHTSSASCVNQDSLAFSSDQYFGRPKDDQLVVPSIEEQAMHNLNEIKENIVNAINKGGVLLEKAKQWLYTNYY